MRRLLPLLALLSLPTAAQTPVWVHDLQELGPLDLPCGYVGQDGFGADVAVLGDVDGNGVDDLAVSLRGSVEAAVFSKVYGFLLDDQGEVLTATLLVQLPYATIQNAGPSKPAVASLGDWDGDGVPDVAIGSPVGVELHLLGPGGGTKSVLSVLAPPANVTFSDQWGTALACLGDLDGDGVRDLAVGSTPPFFGPSLGRVWIYFLHADGTVASSTVIDQDDPALAGQPQLSYFGTALTALGDLDGDGAVDLAVGSPSSGSQRGEVRILFLRPDGSVREAVPVAAGAGIVALLDPGDQFGAGVAATGDLDGDGTGDLAVGAPGDDDGASSHGAVWAFLLRADGTVKGYQKLSGSAGGLALPPPGPFGVGQHFGSALADGGPLSGGRTRALVAGARFAESTTLSCTPSALPGPFGAVYTLDLGPGPLASVGFRNAGSNPSSYVSGPVRTGLPWSATVDLTTTGHDAAFLVGFAEPVEIALPGGQTVLCLGPEQLLVSGPHPGPVASIAVPIPDLPALLGLRLCTQAVHAFGTVPFALSNAQDLLVGIAPPGLPAGSPSSGRSSFVRVVR